jgi:hypothetical protein
MNKAVTQEQLELVGNMTREEMILATAPHIDPESPALKASLERIKPIAVAEAATAVLAQSGPLSGPGPAFTHRDSDDFDWGSDESIVLREQPATAIYHNKHGVLVIRQKGEWDAEHDIFAYITPENCNVFMDALAKVARE